MLHFPNKKKCGFLVSVRELLDCNIPAEQEPLAWLFFAFSTAPKPLPVTRPYRSLFHMRTAGSAVSSGEGTPRAPPAPRARSQRSAERHRPAAPSASAQPGPPWPAKAAPPPRGQAPAAHGTPEAASASPQPRFGAASPRDTAQRRGGLRAPGKRRAPRPHQRPPLLGPCPPCAAPQPHSRLSAGNQPVHGRRHLSA